MKNIVICCDGTANEWASPDKNSNIVQLFCMLEKDSANSRQVTYYDPGVGTRGYAQSMDWFDQATGWSVDENVKQAYEFLMNFYEDGDRIYLFGFSRGAFTVRVLSGLITKSGLLYKRNENLIEYAFKIFRGKDESQAQDFRANLSRTIDIEFLGVWDTVSAVLQKFKFGKLPVLFKDTLLSPRVKYACQALAIDDFRRTSFKPILWGPIELIERMEQVWFAGAHSDVGGGYKEDDKNRRLARVSLQWMLKRAQKKGLILDTSVDVNDIAKDQDPLGDLNRPDLALPWSVLPFLHGPRLIPEKQEVNNSDKIAYTRIHDSVFKRLLQGNGYWPSNLPKVFDLVDDSGVVIERITNLADHLEFVKSASFITN